MQINKVSDLNFENKSVLIRMDLDIDPESKNNLRLESVKPTIDLISKNRVAKIVVLGHRGRPQGIKEESLSIRPLIGKLSLIFNKEIEFEEDIEKVQDNSGVVLLENLRFWSGEERGDPEFAKRIASMGDVYINEAFAASHRPHASIVGVANLLPHAAGTRFLNEVESLSKVFNNPKKPVVVIISGAKKDKIEYIEAIREFTDKILVAGRLPEYLPEDSGDEKLIVAKLLPDKEDITIHSIENFEKIIATAGTVVVSGPIGIYEDEGHRQGTKRVFEAIANSSAYKVAGGGDTEAAISLLGLGNKFDWISVGGGAMLEFLTKKTLPGIDALAG